MPGDCTRYPDFTVADASRGINFYWEHCGMLNDPNYKSRWERKKRAYRSAGILPWEDGGGDNGTLIETRDSENGGLDAAAIAALIEKVILLS